MEKRKKVESIDVVSWIIAVFAMLVVFIPFLNVLALSMSSPAAILQGKVSLLPVDFTLSSYAEMIKTSKVLTGFINSVIYTFSGVVLSLALCALTAYPLSRKSLPGRRILVKLILFTMFFSGGLIPFYILMQNLGLMDNIWAIILPWAIPAFQLFLVKNYFENVPYEIYEAAIVDGASEYRIFGQLYVPLGLPVFATLAIMIATAKWNEYMVPLMYITSPSKSPLQLVLQEMLVEDQVQASTYGQSTVLTPTGLKNATVVISILPLVIAYPFLQKYFIGGIYAGAVKG